MTEPKFSSWESAVSWLRRQPERLELVHAGYYDDPLISAAERYWTSLEWRALRPFLPSGVDLRVLDVGAGRGISSYAFAREGFVVAALEPDPSDLVGAGAIRQLARETQLPIQVIESVSETLPLPDGSFDVVFARAVLHHTQDLEGACREFARVLKPGGRLIAIREHVLSRPADLPAFLEIHPLHRIYGGENAFVLKTYESAIRASGLTLEHVLGPFDSDINLAPLDEDSVRIELARRVEARVRGTGALLQRLLRFPMVWRTARKILKIIDRRPGRLYSFVARRN